MRAATTLSGNAGGPRCARQWLDRQLPESISDTTRADAVLLVSELVTNAVVHASGGCTVALEVKDTRLRIEVSDSSPAFPVLVDAELRTSGRGIAILMYLANRWGWERMAQGKTVWFELSFC